MFKTQVEPQAAGEWFHCKVSNIFIFYFYGLQECRTWKIVVDLFFYNNIYFSAKNQKQNNRHYVTYYVISMVYTLIDHSSRPISARGFALLLQKENWKGLFRHSTSPTMKVFPWGARVAQQ